jgi:hypothetical protein
MGAFPILYNTQPWTPRGTTFHLISQPRSDPLPLPCLRPAAEEWWPNNAKPWHAAGCSSCRLREARPRARSQGKLWPLHSSHSSLPSPQIFTSYLDCLGFWTLQMASMCPSSLRPADPHADGHLQSPPTPARCPRTRCSTCP